MAMRRATSIGYGAQIGLFGTWEGAAGSRWFVGKPYSAAASEQRRLMVSASEVHVLVPGALAGAG